VLSINFISELEIELSIYISIQAHLDEQERILIYDLSTKYCEFLHIPKNKTNGQKIPPPPPDLSKKTHYLLSQTQPSESCRNLPKANAGIYRRPPPKAAVFLVKFFVLYVCVCVCVCNAPLFTKKRKSENFEFSHDIMTLSKLKLAAEYIFFSTIWEYKTSELTKLPHYIKIRTICSNIINTHKAITYVPHAALNNT